MGMKSTCYPILGCHGGGTSLVSALLRDLGVNMGTDFMGDVKDYPTWEDKDFTRLNMRILHMAGGKWNNPPEHYRVMELRDNQGLMNDIRRVIASKIHQDRWGFKDPRLPLTIPLYHPWLPTLPRYIIVKRDRAAIAKSIMSRGGKTTAARWVAFADEHFGRIQNFLEETDAIRLVVNYENLVNRDTALGVIETIARYVRCKKPGIAAKDAMMIVRFR